MDDDAQNALRCKAGGRSPSRIDLPVIPRDLDAGGPHGERVIQADDRETSGANFFDSTRRCRGWASSVTTRARGISGLTVIDVVGADQSLTEYLTYLDRSHLRVQCLGGAGRSYSFRWASGYTNGKDMRIQGVLEHV